MNAIVSAYRRYTDFAGRSNRRDFWLFLVFSMIAGVVLQQIDHHYNLMMMSGKVGVLAGVFGLLTIIPFLALKVRRLHDTGRSGWWILFQLVPLVGTITLLCFMAQQSQMGGNRYGVAPAA